MKKILKAIKNIYFTKTPIYVVFFITSMCNAKCKMCFNWRNTEYMKHELSLDEIKKIFKNFSSIQQLTISGGEPFLRKDLPNILEFISKNNDTQMITIPTNGILTDTIFNQVSEILKRIKKSTHLRIGLSVEGIGKEHDKIVQVNGAFENVKKTYEKLCTLLENNKNLNLDVGICCSSFNKKYLKDILEYCNNYFKECSMDLILARGNPRYRTAKQVTSEEYKEIYNYFNKLKNIKKSNKPFSKIINSMNQIVNKQVIQIMETKKMPSRCYASSKMMVLQSNGEIFPCEYINKNLGNLRNYEFDIKKILKTDKSKKISKFIKEGKCYCTWECALINNIVCNPKKYPIIIKELFKDYFDK